MNPVDTLHDAGRTGGAAPSLGVASPFEIDPRVRYPRRDRSPTLKAYSHREHRASRTPNLEAQPVRRGPLSGAPLSPAPNGGPRDRLRDRSRDVRPWLSLRLPARCTRAGFRQADPVGATTDIAYRTCTTTYNPCRCTGRYRSSLPESGRTRLLAVTSCQTSSTSPRDVYPSRSTSAPSSLPLVCGEDLDAGVIDALSDWENRPTVGMYSWRHWRRATRRRSSPALHRHQSCCSRQCERRTAHPAVALAAPSNTFRACGPRQCALPDEVRGRCTIASITTNLTTSQTRPSATEAGSPRVPTMYSGMLHASDRDQYDVSSLRTSCSGGSAMPVEVLRSFEEAFDCIILEGYGLSETSPVASFNHPHAERKPGSIGTPVAGMEMRLVDDEGRDVGPLTRESSWARSSSRPTMRPRARSSPGMRSPLRPDRTLGQSIRPRKRGRLGMRAWASPPPRRRLGPHPRRSRAAARGRGRGGGGTVKSRAHRAHGTIRAHLDRLGHGHLRRTGRTTPGGEVAAGLPPEHAGGTSRARAASDQRDPRTPSPLPHARCRERSGKPRRYRPGRGGSVVRRGPDGDRRAEADLHLLSGFDDIPPRLSTGREVA
ncbi:AMP-binding protein [Actinomycetospora sp. CA-101289]|uniref:AMP-binding protein n=1 Tax=Actinomycetospora sp. CA-101289 TaxID=3239893 RepID=UPI003D9953A4